MVDQIQELMLQYGIVNPEAVLIRHNENRTYQINDSSNGSVYLLRVHDPVTVNLAGVQHTKEGLESELRMLDAIAQGTDFAVQKPVANLNGNHLAEFKLDGRTVYCSLLHWIEGRNMTKEDFSSSEIAYRLGAQVAKLHCVF